jgi:hypothetical protein
VTSTVQNFYLNQVVEDLLAGDFNLTDYLPGGITFSDPVFFNDAAVNVSSMTQARSARQHWGCSLRRMVFLATSLMQPSMPEDGSGAPKMPRRS